MNWIFEAYSNVYNAAMMQESRGPLRAATANKNLEVKAGILDRLFHRG